MHLLEGVGGDLVFEGLEDGGALLGRELVDDLGDVGRVQQRRSRRGTVSRTGLGVAGLQVDVASSRSGAAWGSSVEARSSTVARPMRRRMALLETSTATTCTKGPMRSELDVVDADDLAAVGVDDLRVEDLAREEELVGLELASRRARRR